MWDLGCERKWPCSPVLSVWGVAGSADPYDSELFLLFVTGVMHRFSLETNVCNNYKHSGRECSFHWRNRRPRNGGVSVEALHIVCGTVRA